MGLGGGGAIAQGVGAALLGAVLLARRGSRSRGGADDDEADAKHLSQQQALQLQESLRELGAQTESFHAERRRLHEAAAAADKNLRDLRRDVESLREARTALPLTALDATAACRTRVRPGQLRRARGGTLCTQRPTDPRLRPNHRS